MITYRPESSDYAWTFGGVDPVMKVQPGDVLEVFTEDCFAGKVQGVDDLPSQLITAFNPQTGPFYVEGAEPGDTLALHLVSLEPARDWAVSTTFPLFGALTSTTRTVTLQIRSTRSSGSTSSTGTQDGRVPGPTATSVDLPLEPMHGTVGVAPAGGEVRSSLVPDAHGGNMDTPEMRAGTTCYLGVNVEGALFSLGDGHYRQGEGETCGVAVEGAMDTVLIVELIKGALTPWPRLEDDTSSCRRVRPGRSRTRSGSRTATWCTGWRRVRPRPARRLPARVADLREPGRERVRPELHVRREGAQALPAEPRGLRLDAGTPAGDGGRVPGRTRGGS